MFPAERDLVKQGGNNQSFSGTPCYTEMPFPAWTNSPGKAFVSRGEQTGIFLLSILLTILQRFEEIFKSKFCITENRFQVLAAVGTGLVVQWQGIISLYLLMQMTLKGVHLVPVKLHQEWLCPTPTSCANVISNPPVCCCSWGCFRSGSCRSGSSVPDKLGKQRF